MNWPKNVLMVNPEFFDVAYAINPHMKDENGNLNKINKGLASKQWEGLKAKFTELGLYVEELKGQQGLPDMVFTANQTFPFFKDGGSQFILSNMASTERQNEVAYFKDWALKINAETYNLKTQNKFEGMGDALWNYETKEIFGGYGFRTSESVYTEIENLTGVKVHTLKLISEDFYHLDTCLAIANKNTAFAVKEGFDKASYDFLKTKFTNLIEIPYEEAKKGFAANLCCVNGTDIIIQSGNTYTKTKAEEAGFKVHELETTEFMKSGGSVFCMKQLYW